MLLKLLLNNNWHFAQIGSNNSSFTHYYVTIKLGNCMCACKKIPTSQMCIYKPKFNNSNHNELSTVYSPAVIHVML